MSDRCLDFIVIGVQKGGTTSLWQYLREHPRIAMPDFKEAPIFCTERERVSPMLASFMRTFDGAGPDAMLGKAATHYMMGLGKVDVGRVADRIAATLPRVRLIALLRDPIERAMSQYTMLVRWGVERRSFDEVVEELLEEERLEVGRTSPTETNSYLVQGEYARILRIYLERIPAERIHVESTSDLATRPGEALDRVLAFLGLPLGYRPQGLGVWHYRGGIRPRLDPEGEAQLRKFMEMQVWPELGAGGGRSKLAFEFFLKTWNVTPDARRPSLSEANRGRLETHYRAEAEPLAKLGVGTPWLDSWRASRSGLDVSEAGSR